MNLATTRVYSTPSCSQCALTKRWLDQRGIEYDAVDLSESPEDFAAVTALGYKQAPVIFVADDVHWGGFRPDLLELNLGGGA